MGILDFIKKPIKELYIARPPQASDALIWKHPDKTVPRGAKLTVRSDEVAVFFLQGRCHGTLEAGPYTLDSANIPFLGQMVVDPLTDGNHYLAELFFVRRAEFLQKFTGRELGTHRDVASGHLVTLTYDIHFGVKVKDPVALITTLGGMEAGSAEKVREFLLGRLESHLRASVGSLMAQMDALQVVSGQHNERIGQMVHELCEDQFKNQGLDLTRFVSLTLNLDEESEEQLKEFGSSLAGLEIQRKGTQIANNPGFANFHIAQGQRSALEGLGEGMATGGNSAPILGVGIGLGVGGGVGPMPGGGAGSPGAPMFPSGAGTASPVAASAGRSPSSMRWYLKSGRGTEGPYTLRQLVLRALAEGETAQTATIKGETDPDWFTAEDEESVKKEFDRRLRNRKRVVVEDAKKSVADTESKAFETLFQVAVEDQLLTRDELAMLAPVALAAGMGEDLATAEQAIIQRAKAYGCRVEEEPPEAPEASEEVSTSGAPPPPRASDGPPPPPRATVYAYDDGSQTEHDLTAQQVVERVRAKPDGTHLVWTQGLETWTAAADVAEIQALIEE